MYMPYLMTRHHINYLKLLKIWLEEMSKTKKISVFPFLYSKKGFVGKITWLTEQLIMLLNCCSVTSTSTTQTA
jgi:hypothetical protein